MSLEDIVVSLEDLWCLWRIWRIFSVSVGFSVSLKGHRVSGGSSVSLEDL